MKEFTLKSSVFDHMGRIPSKYTCDGANVSPPLEWTDPPAATKSFVLISDDPDAPIGTWVHWVYFNIPGNLRGLPEGIETVGEPKVGGRQGINDFRRMGYGGPCPPPGPAHRYFFKLYALDTMLELPIGATKAEVEKAMQGHILAHAQLIGLYERRR